jgi:hypothetical protein
MWPNRLRRASVARAELIAGAERPLAARCMAWLVNAFERAGLHPDMGLHLHSLFLSAGLPAPSAACCPSSRLGIALQTEVAIDTLTERLVAEAAAGGGSICGYM